jgi:hypothetical protein
MADSLGPFERERGEPSNDFGALHASRMASQGRAKGAPQSGPDP